MLELADATSQPLRVEAELRRDPAERKRCLVLRGEPGESIIPIALPSGAANGIEQGAFQHGGHQAPAGTVGRTSRPMLTRQKDVGLEERRCGVADGVGLGVVGFVFVLWHAQLRNHGSPSWPVVTASDLLLSSVFAVPAVTGSAPRMSAMGHCRLRASPTPVADRVLVSPALSEVPWGRGSARMRLAFPGTRGYIDARTPRYRPHTALLVAHRGGRVMIDCGEDWADRADRLRPQATQITHAHSDHAGGLRDGCRCPVYATPDAWLGMAGFTIARRNRRVINCGCRRTIEVSASRPSRWSTCASAIASCTPARPRATRPQAVEQMAGEPAAQPPGQPQRRDAAARRAASWPRTAPPRGKPAYGLSPVRVG